MCPQFHLAQPRFVRSIIPALLFAGLLAGWSLSANAQTSAPSPASQNGAQAIYDIVGTWKVERLWTNQPGANGYKMDDPSALGSLMTVAPETIHWSYPGNHRFVEVGVCTGPKPSLIRDANNARAASAPFAQALPYFGLKSNQLSPAYQMECTGGGHWGPEETNGNSYHMVGSTGMVMRWYDGAILLLKRYGD